MRRPHRAVDRRPADGPEGLRCLGRNQLAPTLRPGDVVIRAPRTVRSSETNAACWLVRSEVTLLFARRPRVGVCAECHCKWLRSAPPDAGIGGASRKPVSELQRILETWIIQATAPRRQRRRGVPETGREEVEIHGDYEQRRVVSSPLAGKPDSGPHVAQARLTAGTLFVFKGTVQRYDTAVLWRLSNESSKTPIGQ